MTTPVFDPAHCQYGSWPVVAKPTIQQGATGQVVGYLQAVLKCTSAQPLSPSSSGPWTFGTSTKTAVRNFQSFWGLTVDGIVGPQTWPLIDWASRGFPT